MNFFTAPFTFDLPSIHLPNHLTHCLSSYVDHYTAGLEATDTIFYKNTGGKTSKIK